MLLLARIGVGFSSIRLVTVSLLPRVPILYPLTRKQSIPTTTQVCSIPSFELKGYSDDAFPGIV